MTTEERLEKLERKIEEMQNIINTKEFCIRDDKGQMGIRLGMDLSGPVLLMTDENGKVRVKINVHAQGPEKTTKDAIFNFLANKSQVSRAGPLLSMYDKNGKLRTQMSVNGDGQSRFIVLDERGNVRVGMFMNEYRPGIFINNENGKTIWSKPWSFRS